jgi:hypothetical protein
MDVGLDQARRHQAPAELERLARGPRDGIDGDDALAGDRDVGQALAVGQAGTAQEQVDGLGHAGTVQSPGAR